MFEDAADCPPVIHHVELRIDGALHATVEVPCRHPDEEVRVAGPAFSVPHGAHRVDVRDLETGNTHFIEATFPVLDVDEDPPPADLALVEVRYQWIQLRLVAKKLLRGP